MITLKVRFALSIKDKIIGLIGHKKPEAIMFLTRFGIHTFDMNFPLDVVVLNGQDVVVKIKEGLKPSHIFFWPIRYQKVLELPRGTIQKQKIRIGSKLNLKP